MPTPNSPTDIFGSAILLSQDEIDDPESVFESVFTDMNLAELRIFLAEILEMCMTTDNASFASPEQRASAILTHAALNRLAQAAWLIVKPQFDAINELERLDPGVNVNQPDYKTPQNDKLDAYYSNMLARVDNLLKLMERIVEALIAPRTKAPDTPTN